MGRSIRNILFLLTPLREGRRRTAMRPCRTGLYFYSRPCGRGDYGDISDPQTVEKFLLTPLREGRHNVESRGFKALPISTHAPAGGATQHAANFFAVVLISTHAPAGGATVWRYACRNNLQHFYSRPCGRGDAIRAIPTHSCRDISTHAPAGGATAIFHKSVMRFCGKLPKDDTVLCLASFGFPGRDPKAVYLAWISCANLPQKCVREGLALKDQGTSCFHEGLASHAFDPVLV